MGTVREKTINASVSLAENGGHIYILTQILCIHSTLIMDFQMSIASLVSSCKTVVCEQLANVKTRH